MVKQIQIKWINKMLVLTVLLTSCKQSLSPKLIDFSDQGCDSSVSYELMMHAKNRITNKRTINDTLELEIFFVENCALFIDPKIELIEDTLLIYVDKWFFEVEKMRVMCDCCFSFNLRISEIPEEKINDLIYKIWLWDEFPQQIRYSEVAYNTYSIDYVIIEGDTIKYDKEFNPTGRRIYSDSRKIEDKWMSEYSCFPDLGDIDYIRRYEETGAVNLKIHNGYYEKRNENRELIKSGKVTYQYLEGEEKGVIVEF